MATCFILVGTRTRRENQSSTRSQAGSRSVGMPSIQRCGVGRTLRAGRRRPQNQTCRLLAKTQSLGGYKACSGASR